eukprot:TRINITY_DN4272_c0_g2_i2.p2 TRINITY_DN4272_c0_g2~~TRINITY_DN4272_c0_g2_i2.p2  ORF type:complete len:224 (+),score=9.40 TRINITY_DN4272_c0_g2_i2:99-674(+)
MQRTHESQDRLELKKEFTIRIDKRTTLKSRKRIETCIKIRNQNILRDVIDNYTFNSTIYVMVFYVVQTFELYIFVDEIKHFTARDLGPFLYLTSRNRRNQNVIVVFNQNIDEIQMFFTLRDLILFQNALKCCSMLFALCSYVFFEQLFLYYLVINILRCIRVNDAPKIIRSKPQNKFQGLLDISQQFSGQQ